MMRPLRLALPALVAQRLSLTALASPPAAGFSSWGLPSGLVAGLVSSSWRFSSAAPVADAAQDEAIAAAVKAASERLGTYTAPTDEELTQRGLTQRQIQVTRHDGTEPAFKNKYWDNHQAGIYVDIISKGPLYSSTDKFESGSGWPSFVRVLPGVELKTKTDYNLGYGRTEMRSPISDAHLGHIFTDGPRKRGGMRHCANSASLRFIPVHEMGKEGFKELRDALFPGWEKMGKGAPKDDL